MSRSREAVLLLSSPSVSKLPVFLVGWVAGTGCKSLRVQLSSLPGYFIKFDCLEGDRQS